MCFAIPYKVLRVKKDNAVIENGKTIKIGDDFRVTTGDYLQVIGNFAVGKISKIEGKKIRGLIKKLNV